MNVRFPGLHSALDRDKISLVHGEVIFRPAMPVSALFLVEAGGILVFSPVGFKILRTIVSDQVVGLQELLTHGYWNGLGVAQGPTRLRAFSADRLRRRMDEAPQAHQRLLHALAHV